MRRIVKDKSLLYKRLGAAWLAIAMIEIALYAYVDKPLALAVQSLTRTNPDIIGFFKSITDFGKGYWYAWPSGIGFLLLFALTKWRDFGEPTRKRMSQASKGLLFFFVSTSLAGLTTDLLKILVGRARPKLFLNGDSYGFAPLSTLSDWNGMPSGHTTTVFAVAAALAILYPKWQWVWFSYAILLGASRVMVNAHYASDVVLGVCVALAITSITEYVFTNKGLLSARQKGATFNLGNIPPKQQELTHRQSEQYKKA